MRASVTWIMAPWLAFLFGAATLEAQGKWEPPAESCPIETDHYLLRSASLYLKQATETNYPAERDRFLDDAKRVLADATSEIPDNPGTWYFLGRLYVLRRDVSGADTALRRAQQAVPGCRDDIARWRKTLASHALYAGTVARQAQLTDSAVRMLRLVQAMDSTDPRGLVELAGDYLNRELIDSAELALEAAYDLEPPDRASARQLANVHLAVIGTYRQRVATEEALPRWDAARSRLEALERDIAADSSVLANMLADVARIRGQGRRLDAQSLRAFQAESTARHDRLARARAMHDSVRQGSVSDSAAVAAALGPAIAKYEEYVERYPARVEATADLARLYALGSHTEGVNRTIDRLLDHADSMTQQQLFQAGSALLSGGQPAAGVRILAGGLEQNPYDRNGLYLYGRAWVMLQEPDSALRAARRLLEVDPNSDQSLRLMALAWQERENADSATHYAGLANSGLERLVVITQFAMNDGKATLGGTVRNRGTSPLEAAALTVEFLSTEGDVVDTRTVEIPALEPGGYEAWTVEGEGAAIVAWRYRIR